LKDPLQIYVLPTAEAETQRLELQARLYGGISFIEPYLAAHPRRVLDVGSGSGYFSRLLAERLPESQVTGVDIDESRLAFARDKARGVANLSFQSGELCTLPFEDASFDLAYCRFVLLHLVDPREALREIARVLRPGGRLVALDMVHDGVWFSPPKPAFSRLLADVVSLMRDRGLEPNQGLYLASAMQRAGLSEVSSQVLCHHINEREPLFSDYRQNWMMTVQHLAAELGDKLDRELVVAALTELSATPNDCDQQLLEITLCATAIATPR
jgi:ubiquinone/menaquinone biosynthesis C-methylase UbiE